MFCPQFFRYLSLLHIFSLAARLGKGRLIYKISTRCPAIEENILNSLNQKNELIMNILISNSKGFGIFKKIRHLSTAGSAIMVLAIITGLVQVYANEIPSGIDIYLGDSSQEANIYFGDPHVFTDNGIYYIYGTRNSDTGIEVYMSEDLENWTGPAGATEGFALHRDDVYGDHGFWAPEVYRFDNRYYMFFSVERHMAIAISDNPLGPFVQDDKTVLADFEAIDHHLFIDDDGTYYIFFARFDDGLKIWGAELEEDFSAIRENTMKLLMQRHQEWEKSSQYAVNEGPEVVKYEGRYYMLFSANSYTNPDYGIGLAYSDHPLGPWTKVDENPILQNPEGLAGVGHCMLFEGLDGNLYMSYHAHNDKDNVHPRKAYINPVRFVKVTEENRYTLEVLPPRMELKYRLADN